jgi:hypothetical protein
MLCVSALGCHAASVTSAMIPPVPQPTKVVTNYVAVRACLGTNHSDWSNELPMMREMVMTNEFGKAPPPITISELTFNPSDTPGVTYEVGIGRVSHVYTYLYQIGTNTQALYPLPPNPVVTTAGWGGYTFFLVTNAQGNLNFRAYLGSKGSVSISTSSDLQAWTSSFAVFRDNTAGPLWIKTQ